MESDEPGAKQIAYRIEVGSKPGLGDLWDTGQIDDHARPFVEYAGVALPSRFRAYWRVTVWDQNEVKLVSEPSWWETGLKAIDEWRASWIQGPLCGGPLSTVPAAYFRRSFSVTKHVAAARLYVTALGLYVAELNGARVGDHHLAPGWTDYRKRLRYQTFDVIDQLRVGENVLALVLGDGWYCGHVGWRNRQFYGDRPKLLAQLELTYSDGSRDTISTDDAWRCGTGPILEADLLMGEAYDARRTVITEWPVEITQPNVGVLTTSSCPPIRKICEVAAISVKEVEAWPATRYIFDFGQNLVGHVRLKVRAVPGQHFRLRHGEVLDADAKLYVDNLRSARCTDSFTARGDGEETWEPSFTFHGFRYVEVTGFSDAPSLDAATAIVVHTDLPQTGDFECSEPLINRLQKNILWGWRGNSLDVPTDCPQRDERLGWTGDAQVFAPTACFNTFALTFFEKFLQDLEDAQQPDGAIPPVAPDVDLGMTDGGPAWSDALVLIIGTLFSAYGDKRAMHRHYAAMKRWLEQQIATSRDGIRCYEDYDGFRGFGDWLSIEADTPKDWIGTAYFLRAATTMAAFAHELGREADRAKFENLASQILAARDLFFAPQANSMSQTSLALFVDYPNHPSPLGRAELIATDIAKRGDHLSTGFVGAPLLLDVLTNEGRLDVAYKLLEQTSWPSWLYPVTQGATTIWERWDGWTEERGFQDPGMNSFNHYAYGSIGDWLYRTVGGIRLQNTLGWPDVEFRAQPGGSLTSAKASLATAQGKVESSWRIEAGRFHWHVAVPPNMTATLWFPTNSGQLPSDYDAGTGVTLDSGVYDFETSWSVA